MIIVYGLKMIRDYISGAYIDDKTLDILEDSVQFMTQVIAITKDKFFQYTSNIFHTTSIIIIT